ncbi:DddA-like double-stranded DNA deaminase toxin [Actinosynnema sp. NPDC020468]
MVGEGIRHATVVINSLPCVGPFGCDTLVPILLRYAGGARPWWR